MGLLNQADERARASLKNSQDGRKPREYLSEALWSRAWLLKERGREQDASRLDDERKALWKEHVTNLADLTTRLAVRADVIGYGTTTVPPAGQNVRHLDREQAAANLGLALEGGFYDLDKLRMNLDVKPLLDRQDLKLLLERRSVPEKPPEK